MKRKIVIDILCAAVSMGTIGCGNSTASAKTTQTQTDKKEDSKRIFLQRKYNINY